MRLGEYNKKEKEINMHYDGQLMIQSSAISGTN